VRLLVFETSQSTDCGCNNTPQRRQRERATSFYSPVARACIRVAQIFHNSLLYSGFGTSKRPSAIDSSTVTTSDFSSRQSGMAAKLPIYLEKLL